jgi:hypothetical protein
MPFDDGDDCRRIRAIADEVAEQREAIGAAAPRMAEACLQRFEVGVNVGQAARSATEAPRSRTVASMVTDAVPYAVGASAWVANAT